MGAILSSTDIEQIAAVLPRLYAAVEWNAERAPDWAAFRDCCHPQVLFVPMGSGVATPIALEPFVAGMEEQRGSGAVQTLREVETSCAVEGYANLASVRSTFTAMIDGAERRGVTFAHLVREQDGRWLIVAAAWENEQDGEPLPGLFD
jgi:hypothetical protein